MSDEPKPNGATHSLAGWVVCIAGGITFVGNPQGVLGPATEEAKQLGTTWAAGAVLLAPVYELKTVMSQQGITRHLIPVCMYGTVDSLPVHPATMFPVEMLLPRDLEILLNCVKQAEQMKRELVAATRSGIQLASSMPRPG